MPHRYIHVLADTDPLGAETQLICDDCRLVGDEWTEGWENFLNGEWTVDDPQAEGFYPVRIGSKGVYAVQKARVARNSKARCIWDDVMLRSQIRERWSFPFPQPSEEV